MFKRAAWSSQSPEPRISSNGTAASASQYSLPCTLVETVLVTVVDSEVVAVVDWDVVAVVDCVVVIDDDCVVVIDDDCVVVIVLEAVDETEEVAVVVTVDT